MNLLIGMGVEGKEGRKKLVGGLVGIIGWTIVPFIDLGMGGWDLL